MTRPKIDDNRVALNEILCFTQPLRNSTMSELKTAKFGKAVRYDVNDSDAFVTNGRQESLKAAAKA
jgi:hypothetical protein